MSNQLMSKLSKLMTDGGACAESQITKPSNKVDPTEAARTLFIEKIEENIAVWKAINADEELPVHKLNVIDKKTGMKKIRKYAQWFKMNEKAERYELIPRHGLKPIKDIFGEGKQVLYGLKENEVLPILNALKESSTDKELDEILLLAREAAKVNRKKS